MPQIKIPDALIAGYSSLGILITSYILAFITSFALMNFKVGIQTRRDKYLSTLSYYIYVHQTIGFAILGALISNFNIPESKNILFIIVLGMTFLSLLIQNIIFKFLKKFKRFYGKT